MLRIITSPQLRTIADEHIKTRWICLYRKCTMVGKRFMQYYIHRFIFFFILFSIVSADVWGSQCYAEKTFSWYDYYLLPFQDSALKEKAKKNVTHWNRLSDDSIKTEHEIFSAGLRNSDVIVCYGYNMDMYICIYDLDGIFLDGYHIVFSISNGIIRKNWLNFPFQQN